jgi:hypothetical protein
MTARLSRLHRTTIIPRTFALAALTLALVATDGTAQEAATPQRSGFHFAIGAGAGSMAASCTGCSTDFFQDRLNGFSGVLQLGGMATSRLAIAAEFMGWISNEPPVYRRVAGLSLVLLGYPSETSGFFVKGGFGGVRAIAEDDFVLIQTDAFMGISGIGMDIRMSDKTMITPYANYVWSFSGETWVNQIVSPVVALPNAVQVGVALTVH